MQRMQRTGWAVATLLALYPTTTVADSPKPGDSTTHPRLTAADGEVSKILFLNRCVGGCTIEPGIDDARTNHSSIVASVSVLSEWEHGDDAWDAVVQCVQQTYAPYDIEVTDVDPGPEIKHHEVMVAGAWQEIGFPNAACGAALWRCSPANNLISFSFANSCYGSPEEVCAVASQEAGHSFGLEHVLNCSDPMTYLEPCGRRFFRDTDASCGEYDPVPCSCGATEQNSHSQLIAALGPSPTPLPAPDIEILTPEDGAQVSETVGFLITADATHMRGIGHVDLYLNGDLYDTVEGHPYNVTASYGFWAPDRLPPSILDVEVRAYDDLGTESIAIVTVTRGAPCASANDCIGNQECTDGRCYFPPGRGELGDLCTEDLQCIGALCAPSGDEGYCSQWCELSETARSCPEGFECLEVHGRTDGACWPIADEPVDPGCGCIAGGSAHRQPRAPVWLVLAVVLLGAVRRTAGDPGAPRPYSACLSHRNCA